MINVNKNIHLSIVIPTINSEQFILKTLFEISNETLTFPYATEIILVDDNSSDKTCDQIKNFIKKNTSSNIKLIKNNNNYGQSISTINGLKIAQGNYIIIFDDDLQYDVKDLNKLVNSIEKNKLLTMICGHRNIKKNTPYLNKFIRKIAIFFFTTFFPDFQNKNYFTSFKIFKRELLFKEYSFGKNNIYFFWTQTTKKISWINVDYHQSIRGKSNYSKMKILFEFRFLLIKLFQRIILFFSIIFLILFIYTYEFSHLLDNKTFIYILFSNLTIYLISSVWLKIINYKMMHAKFQKLK